MPKNTYYLTAGGMLNGKAIAPGEAIATLETPDGVEIDRALGAILHGLASPNPPAPAAAQTPAPAPSPAAPAPAETHAAASETVSVPA